MNYQNYSISFIKACCLFFYDNFSVQFELCYVQVPRHIIYYLVFSFFKKMYLHTNYEVFCKERRKVFVEGGKNPFLV